MHLSNLITFYEVEFVKLFNNKISYRPDPNLSSDWFGSTLLAKKTKQVETYCNHWRLNNRLVAQVPTHHSLAGRSIIRLEHGAPNYLLSVLDTTDQTPYTVFATRRTWERD